MCGCVHPHVCINVYTCTLPNIHKHTCITENKAGLLSKVSWLPPIILGLFKFKSWRGQHSGSLLSLWTHQPSFGLFKLFTFLNIQSFQNLRYSDPTAFIESKMGCLEKVQHIKEPLELLQFLERPWWASCLPSLVLDFILSLRKCLSQASLKLCLTSHVILMNRLLGENNYF